MLTFIIQRRSFVGAIEPKGGRFGCYEFFAGREPSTTAQSGFKNKWTRNFYKEAFRFKTREEAEEMLKFCWNHPFCDVKIIKRNICPVCGKRIYQGKENFKCYKCQARQSDQNEL